MDTPLNETTTNPTNEIIDMDAPNTVAVTRDLQNELAAVTSAWFAKRQEKKKANKKFGEELGEFENRMEELIAEIVAGGTQLVMHFGTKEEGDAVAAAADEADDELESEEEATGTDGDDTAQGSIGYLKHCAAYQAPPPESAKP
jgi:uncharacterized coiled-coil DUF342 family protein